MEEGGVSCLFIIRYVAVGLTMQADGGTGVLRLTFLTSALNRGEWLASLPGHLTPGKVSGYTLCRRPIGPQSRSGRFEEEKNLHTVV